MNQKGVYRWRICFVLIAIFCSGLTYSCKGAINQYLHPEMNPEEIKNIAVLPLDNLTSNTYADDKLTGIVIMDLLSRGIDVTEPGEVALLQRELQVTSSTNASTKTIQFIGNKLNTNAVIIGSVVTFDMQKGITVQYPEVSIQLLMIDTVSGDIMWSVWHTSGGADFWTRHFGAEGATLDETSRIVVKEALDTVF